VRYLDLEVDVVRYPDGEVAVVDQEVLARKAEDGLIPQALAIRALEAARSVAEGLNEVK
jgi:predicted RNA-binding protein associated with RNAse of E/G family